MRNQMITTGKYKGLPGEWSTVVLPDGTIETCFFPDDDSSSTVVSRTQPVSLAHVHRENVREFNGT